MKKLSTSLFMRMAIAIALLFTISGTAAAWDFMYNGLAYNYDGDGTSVYVTYTSANSDNYGGSLTNVVIPAKITFDGGVSYNVTGIGKQAFYYCSNLQSITIPSSIKTIGQDAFYGTDIKKLTVSSLDAWIKTTLNSVISTPHEMYVGSSLLTSVTFPSTVTTVGMHFYNVTSIKSVTIPNTVTEIGNQAFYNCSNLATVNMGNGVKTIGSEAFVGCNNLKALTIPESVESLGYNALNFPLKEITWNAINLTYSGGIPTMYNYQIVSQIEKVTIGNKVQTLPEYFVAYSKITSISYPSSLRTIGDNAFKGCTGLTVLSFPNYVTVGHNAFANCTGLKKITIPEYVGTYYQDSFTGCTSVEELIWNNIDFYWADGSSAQMIPATNITKVTFGNTVKIIPAGILKNSKISSVTLPASVTTIGASAFENCSLLSAVVLPKSVATIGDYAFRSCTGLTSLTIPENLTSIGTNAFSGCNSITQLTWNAINLTTNGGISTSNITKVTIGSNVKTIPSNFVSNSKITSISIPSSVTTIGPSAFQGCANLTSVTIPSSVNSWGSSMFKNCTSLKTVSLPSNLTFITQEMFYGCTSLTSAPLPANVTSIGNSAFYNCTGLTALTIPEKLNSIGSSAFYGCSNITQLTWNAINLTTNGGITTSNITKVTIGDKVQTIPSNFVSGSKITSVSFPSGVKSIGASAFASCTSLTSATLPTAITSIESNTFQNCTSLKAISIPNNVTSIGNSAFDGCTGLSSLTIPEQLTSIGNNAFYNCSNITQLTWNAINLSKNGGLPTSNITKVTIGDKVQTIPSNFVSGSRITSVTFPSSVKTIGSSAFMECYGLKTVTIPDKVTSIGDCAFYKCGSLKYIHFNDELESIGGSAFYGDALTVLRLPKKITSIGIHVFSYNPLKKVIIESKKMDTDNSSFYQCNIPMTILPNGCTLNNYATSFFYNCEYLDPNTSFEIDGITYVITDMINRLVKIVDIDETKCASNIEVKKVKYRNVEFTPTDIGISAAAGNYTVQTFNTGDIIMCLPAYSFYKCDALQTIELSNTKTIEEYAFSYSSLRTVSMPNVETIKSYAFVGSGLTKVTIPNSIKTIEQRSFMNCKQMTEFVVGTGVSTIDQYVLKGCSALRRVELGTNVTNINANSFDGCGKIKTLRVRRSTPPNAVSGVFNDLDKWSCTLYVPKGTVDRYKNADEWKTFFFISDDETEPSDGDVNGDGKINVSDVTALINMIMGITTMDEASADVNGDGKVNVSDVSALINIILGIQ